MATEYDDRHPDDDDETAEGDPEPATFEQQVRTKVVTGPDRPTPTTSRIAETK